MLPQAERKFLITGKLNQNLIKKNCLNFINKIYLYLILISHFILAS